MKIFNGNNSIYNIYLFCTWKRNRSSLEKNVFNLENDKKIR